MEHALRIMVVSSLLQHPNATLPVVFDTDEVLKTVTHLTRPCDISHILYIAIFNVDLHLLYKLWQIDMFVFKYNVEF